MKKTVQKFLSLFLVVCMLMGCVILIAPETVTPVSADAPYADIPANITVTVNGVKIRYDRYSGNDEGYVHVFADGKIEFKIRHGDMVWFPELVMTNDSVVHGEVTVISGTYQHSGFAYNVATSGDGSYASAMIAGYNNGGRVRIAGDTKANLGNNNGSDGYGTGGVKSKRPIGDSNGDDYIIKVAGVPVGLNNYYAAVKNSNSEVAVGKTVGIDLSRSDGKVYAEWLAIGYGAYHKANYTDSTSVAPYLYAGGSVGYGLLYQNYNNDYIVRRIEALSVTNCTVSGDSTDKAVLVGDDYTNVPADTTVMVNGINIRYDRYSGNDDGYVHVFADGTIELKIRHGDMVWFPDLVMTDNSAVHGEVTVISETEPFSGFAFNVVTDGGDSYASAMLAVYRSNGRIRISGDTKANLGKTVGDGYGSGGDSRKPVDDNITNSQAGLNNYYNEIKEAVTNNVAVGKTVGVDLCKSDGEVCAEWLAVGYGAYDSRRYTDNDTNAPYTYAGGSVGYGLLWQGTSESYIVRKIEKLSVTNCTYGGQSISSITLAGFVNVTPNTNFVYNGRTYRLDVYSGNTGSFVHINENGTMDMKIRHGDMLWFPDVQMTDSTAIHAEVTAMTDMSNKFSGLAYAVRPDGNGVWANTMVAVMKSSSRLRITSATRSSLGTVSGGDRGNGGDQRTGDDGGSQSAYYNTQAYKYIETNTTNHDWAKNKTLSFDVSNASGTVSVTWGNPNIGSFATKSYSTASNSAFSYTGAVGYTPVWTNSDEYFYVRMERLTVTNCTVGGDATAVWSGIGRELPAHTNTTVNGVVYRFDPLDAHTTSSCWIMDDNTFRVRLQAGDLFWLPESGKAAGASLTAKMIANNGQKNSGNLAGGIAYNINVGENGTWGDSSDSLNSAHLQTDWRRRVGYTTVGNANGSITKLGDYSTYTLGESDRNAAYEGFGNRWNTGDVVKTDLSVSGSGVLNISYRDENDVQMNFDRYTIGSGDNSAYKVMNGPIGFYVFWEGDSAERYSMTVDILDVSVSEGVTDTSLNTTLDGVIGLNFKFQASDYVAGKGSVVVTKAGVEVVNTPISGLWNESEEAYICTAPIYAKEMTDSVNFSIQIGGAVYNGYSYTATVQSYAQALAASDSSWSALMNAMLKYGAAAQQLFGYKTNNLPASTSGITYDASSAPSLTIDASCSSFISEVLGTLTLESGTDLNLYVLPKNTKTYTATANNGSESVDVTVEKKYDAKNSSTYYWKITISDLKAEELGNEFFITVSDGTHSVTFTYSALCWVKSAINSSQSTAATKTLAKAVGVYAGEAQKKNNVTVDSLAGMVAGTGAVSALRATTDSRITSIRNSSNDTSLVWTGKIKNYYVSSSDGNDSNSGVSSDKPWKTLAKVNAKLNEGSSSYKYNIYLKRGDTWRGEYLKTYKTSNVTITTYGSGAKPIIMGSPENGATASKWTEVETNIWRYAGSDSWADVGNIVFNNGESFGRKVVQLYVKNDIGTTLTDYTHPTAGAQSVAFSSYTDLKNDLDFYHDKNFEGGSGATGYLYLYSTSNPGSRFTSIEFSVDQHGIEIYKANNVKVDNICVKYVGGHGIAGNGLNLQNILIQNCEFGWIGGSIIDRIDASSIGTTGVFPDERYGNGVEIYGGCNNFRVQNNYIYQCFDAGITQQYNCKSCTDSDHTANQLNIYYHNNVIENCNYSIEYFLSNCPTGNSSYISDFNITNNLMWNAGKGFCETRVIWGRGFSAHVKAQSGTYGCNRFANTANAFVISGNKFIGERDAVFAICSKMSASNANANPVITNNEIYGVYKTNKIGAICNIDIEPDDNIQDNNLEIHKVYALYDKNIQTYMNGQIGSSKFSGNTIKFLVNF